MKISLPYFLLSAVLGLTSLTSLTSLADERTFKGSIQPENQAARAIHLQLAFDPLSTEIGGSILFDGDELKIYSGSSLAGMCSLYAKLGDGKKIHVSGSPCDRNLPQAKLTGRFEINTSEGDVFAQGKFVAHNTAFPVESLEKSSAQSTAPQAERPTKNMVPAAKTSASAKSNKNAKETCDDLYGSCYASSNHCNIKQGCQIDFAERQSCTISRNLCYNRNGLSLGK